MEEVSTDIPSRLRFFWTTYKPAIILGTVSIILILLSITILIKSVQTATPITFSTEGEASVAGAMRGSEVAVDVAGGVLHPGVYRLPSGSRVEDAIRAAGGLSAEADSDRLAKLVNRAAKLSDGAKLYIPKVGDTVTGSRPVNDGSSSTGGFETSSSVATGSLPVSINAASQSELEALSGVGPATARKIIDGRPYRGLEELVTKKAMGQSLFGKLKDQLTL